MLKVDSLADNTKKYIKGCIFSGELKPGQQIKEQEIASSLGISRPPLREALKMLEAEGLVFRKPRRGVFVSSITEQDMWEVYTLKACLYELAVEIAIRKISEREIEELEAILSKMAQCAGSDPCDVRKYQTHHIAFHKKIMDVAGNERLKNIALNLHNQVTRYSHKTLQMKDHLVSSMDYHHEILAAIKDRNRPLACRLVKEHVLNALNVLRGIPDLISEADKESPLKNWVYF